MWKQKRDEIPEQTGIQVLRAVLVWKKGVQVSVEIVSYASDAFDF